MANQDFELDSQFKMIPFGCSEQQTVLFEYEHWNNKRDFSNLFSL